METTPDIVIIGSGIGGATVASGLAASGANILILEAGDHIADRPENRDQRAIFQRGHFRPKEMWYEHGGEPFNPGNYYNVGGNSKFYGAVLVRYRREDFLEMQHREGVSPAWPFSYEELEPWYSRAEQLFQVRGALGQDPTEPHHSQPYPFPPVPDEPAIASVRGKLQASGIHTYSLPLGVDIDKWLARAKTPWDAHPNSFDGKMDAETTALAYALQHKTVKLQTKSRVTRLDMSGDGNRIETVHYQQNGEAKSVSPKLVILAAGAVQSSVLLLRQLVRPGRPQLHEPQFERGAGGLAFLSQRLDLSEDIRVQRFLPLGRRGRPAAWQCPASRPRLGRDSEGEHAVCPRMAAQRHFEACDRFLRDERGYPASREPDHGRRRQNRAEMASDELGCASRPGSQAQGRAEDVGLPDRAVAALRQAHAVASVRHGEDGQRPRDIAARHVLPVL
jgi:glycine/D-amino acid oxidase-like deaminating enzyme